MESTQELQHWGIKGQRWGVRRYQNPDGTLTEAGKKRYYYQNPDGSLTEAGKKDYMKAAKKGKLDVSKLSDNDLNMINSRFAREKTFKQNVKEYEDSRFSTKLKNAVIERVKGIKGGKGKGKGGGSGLGKILALPIKKAFEEAFKDQKFDDKDDDGNKSPEEKEAIKLASNGYRYMQSGYHEDKKERAAREANGRRFMDSAFNNRESRTAEDVLRGRNKHDRTHTTATESKSGPRNLRGLPSGGIYMDPSEYTIHSAFVVKRSDELYHWGIKGQKWGVRRYQNPDGTLTEAGKARIAKTSGSGYLNPSYEDRKSGKADNRSSISEKYSKEYWKHVESGMDENSPSEEGRKLWNKFKTEYASATLKDLKMHDTPQSRKEVKKILAQIDPSYLYSHGNNETNYEKYWERENRRDEKFAARRKQIEHPKRDKVTKTAKNAANAAIKAAPIISAIT